MTTAEPLTAFDKIASGLVDAIRYAREGHPDILAHNILNAAEAVLGPMTRPCRAALLAQHDEFKGWSIAALLDLAAKPR